MPTPKVLVLGAAGMLGHRVLLTLRGRFETWGTVRQTRGLPQELRDERIIDGVEAGDEAAIATALHRSRCDVVVNCIGVVKQSHLAKDPEPSVRINALLPHVLTRLCQAQGARLIHISTDCVFSGRKGHYTEDDAADPVDLYGHTKLLGEVHAPRTLTLRTSIIGRELHAANGLLEWFLSQRGKTVSGYRNAWFSGMSTDELARLISEIIAHHPTLTGLHHAGSDRISKLDLLERLKAAFQLPIEIRPTDEPRIDRSLDSGRFKRATGLKPADWSTQCADLARSAPAYEAWRKQRGP